MTKEVGTIKELYRLFESKKFWTEQFKGQPLATAVAGGVNLSGVGDDAWPITFEDDFNDITATLGNNDDTKLWKVPGPYSDIGSGHMAPYSPAPVAGPIYRQESPSVIGILARKDTGVYRWSGNLSTGTFAAHPQTYNDESNISFAQQYYYAEARIRMPNPADPVSANVILWPAFWAYSINNLGGPTHGDLTRNPVEKDFLEWYLDPSNLTGTSTQFHAAMHHHEPQKLIGPGAWGRDVNCSVIDSFRNKPEFGTDLDWRPWNDFNLFGCLHTPEEIIVYFNRIEVARGAIPPRYHSKDYFLLSHQLSSELAGGMVDNQEYVMECDYVRIWQNPDWHTVTGGWASRKPPAAAGTAAAATMTTALPMADYQHGRMFVREFPTALSAGATLRANALGTRPIYRYANYETIPPSGALTPIQDGDVAAGGWHGVRYDSALNGGTGGWRLQNAGWSYKTPTQWNPTPSVRTPIVIDRTEIEAGIAEKHGVVTTIFPEGHPGQTRVITDTAIPPKMTPSKGYLVVENLAPGSIIDTVAPINVPTRPVLYSATGSNKYVVDPVTGVVSVAPGAALTIGTDEVLIGAWPQPPQALVKGNNVQKMLIEVKPDIPFDLSYFADDAIGTLPVWIEPGDIATLDIHTDNTVIAIRDKLNSDYEYRTVNEAVLTNRASYDATGLNGRPTLVATNAATRYVYPAELPVPIATSVFSLFVVRNSNQLSVTIHGVGRNSAVFDPLNVHMCMFVWEPGSVQFFVDDVNIGLGAGAVQTGISSRGFAFCVLDPSGYGGGGLGRIYDSGSLMNSGSNTSAFAGDYGRLAIGYPAAGLSIDYRQKIFGEAAHTFGLTGLLAADHPYKTVAPRMYS